MILFVLILLEFYIGAIQHVLKSKKKLSLLFLLVLLPLVSAVQIDSGTIIQSVGLNTTLNFTSTFHADVIQVESNSIYLERFALTSSASEYLTMNLTNRNMTGFNAPYISASSSTSKTITSQLSQAVNATVVVSVSQCEFDAEYNNIGVEPISCAGGVATFVLTDIPAGTSTLLLVAVVENCDALTSGSVTIILVFSALAVLSLSLVLVWKWREGDLDIKTLLVVFIAVMVSLGLFVAVAQNLSGVCSA